jgi:glycosyltransferase involved in cell wall biosynthesis
VKVLAISSYGGLGGAELHLATFAEHRPADVELEALVLEDGPLAARLAALGLVTRTARYAGRPDLARVARFTRPFATHLRLTRPDVVWAKGQKAALLAAPACRLLGVPLVWHKVDFSFDRQLAVPLAAASNGVIGVSRAVLAALGPLRRARVLGVAGVPVGLPRSAIARLDPERPVIGNLARLVPYKGLHHIIEAAAELSGEFPALRVVLAGGDVPEYPDYRQQLLDLAAKRGIAERVELPGFVEDPATLLVGTSVFVSATYRDEQGFGWEGLPGAVLEASWVGVPVVATRAGGTLESVRDGETGTLVDSPAGLAPAIAAYLRDPELAARRGAAGRAFAREHFAPHAASERLFAMLRIAARRSGGGRPGSPVPPRP